MGSHASGAVRAAQPLCTPAAASHPRTCAVAAAPRRAPVCRALRRSALLSCRSATATGAATGAAPRRQRLKRCPRAASGLETRAEVDGIDLLAEVQQEGGGAVRAALEALRNKRRERELVGFYSMPKLERRVEPGSGDGSADPVAALRAKHQQELTQLRTRLNGRLSKASAYARHCDKAIRNRDATVATVHEELTRLRHEMAALAALAAVSATDPKQSSFNYVSIAERSKAITGGLDASIEHANRQRVRPVEIQWTGMAEDVRVMGSFDGWTHGIALSPSERDAYTTFSARLQLLPGTYQIKFLIDSQWRIAADWPQTGEGPDANNELVVGDDAAFCLL